MRKFLLSALSLYVSAAILHANTVPVEAAQKVAANFYRNVAGKNINGLTLVYTSRMTANSQSVPLYYVFKVSNTPQVGLGGSGFIIVSAEDALSPIIGYSTESDWVVPQAGTNIYYWMQKIERQAIYCSSNNIRPTQKVAAEWNDYSQSVPAPRLKRPQTPPQVLPLCQSTWNQSPYYNALCPGGSVTGCVATTMAQIMRYWSYPPHGIDSSFYTESSPENYGLLKANYDTSNYLWNAMPYNISSNNNEIAKLMYDCGVSVNMSYSPSESGAWVINADNRISAQSSFVNYFGYDANTIQGLKRKNFNDSAWMTMIKSELNSSRLVQYAGWDSANGGHTWVCDGYDTNSNLHMNWGWGGFDDGYFKLDTLNPYPYFFSKTEEILIGIEPPPLRADFKAVPVNGCAGIQVNFSDRSFVYNNLDSITAWQWTFPGGTPASSALKNPTIIYSTSGVYPVTLVVTNNSGTDTLTRKTYVTVNGINVLPFVQGFEGVGTFPPSQWTLYNPWRHATTWHLSTGTGGFGNSSHCLYYNNCQNGTPGERDQIYTPAYNFSSVAKPYLFFDVAYAPYNNVYSDTLAVYYSLDCGNTFTKVYMKGGMNLCTTGGQTVLGGANQDMNGCFVPLSNNWRTDTIFIPAIAGQSSVMFSFENRSGNGSNLYLDNINVSLALGINQPAFSGGKVNLYPNPANTLLYVQISLQKGQTVSFWLFNSIGKQVMCIDITNELSTIPVRDLPAGLYFYRIVDNNCNVLKADKQILIH